jgi:hypothetical protein
MYQPSMWVHARFEQVIQAKKSNMPIPKRPDPIAAPPNSTQKVQQRSRMLQAIVRRLQYSQFLSAIWPPFFARSGPASPVPARQQRRRRMHTRRPRRRRRHGPAPLPPDSEALVWMVFLELRRASGVHSGIWSQAGPVGSWASRLRGPRQDTVFPLVQVQKRSTR